MKLVKLVQCSTCFGFLLFFIYGTYSYVFNVEENKCEMTYMFEYPQFIEIPLNKDVEKVFPRYGLFVYGEGKQADEYRNGIFEGVPVLFIPGNSGSSKQVRSLGSVAYRKSLESRKGVKLDFFTIHFNEELSALFGGVLHEQVNFTKEAIKRVVSLYKGRQSNSLVLISHSMGGLVAKAAVDMHSPVRTIITLATPHQSPVVVFDKVMNEFYKTVQMTWSKVNLHKRITLASIGGADRDFQVRSGLTMENNSSVNALTTEIPGAWVSADHLCIMWCKQVVTVIVRALFDLIDPVTRNWVEDHGKRNEVLNYHLVKRYSGKSIRSVKNMNSVSFDPDGRWREVIASQFVGIADKEEPVNTYFMIPLVDNAHRDRLTAIGAGVPANWVFGCVATSWRKSVRFCERGDNLSDQTVFLPYTDSMPKRKQVYLDLRQLRQGGYTHVIFSIPKTHAKGSITFDVHRSAERILSVWPRLGVVPTSENLKISAEILCFNMSLPSFSQTWQSVDVTVKGISNCLSSERKALVRKIVPWSSENQFYWTNDTIEVHLHKPKSLQDEGKDPAHIQVLNPNQCSFEISITYSWTGIWSQLARFYFPFILPMVSAVYLFCLYYQMRFKAVKSPVPNVTHCIFKMPILKALMCIEGIAFLIRRTELAFQDFWPVPKSDVTQLDSQALSFPFMFVILGAIAWSLALIIGVIFLFAITAGGHVFESFVIRYLRSYLGVSSIFAELLATGFSKLPAVISIGLIAVGTSTCGSFSLFLGLLISFWKLFTYFEDELESMLSEEEQENNDDSFRINTTISLLWLCTAVLSVPSLIVWIRDPRLSLRDDPFLVPSYLWSFFGMIALYKSELDRPGQLCTYARLGYVIFAFAALSLFYGIQALYRIPYFTTAAIVVYGLKQLA